MKLELNYQSSDFFKNKVVNHDICCDATLGQLFNAIEFLSDKDKDACLKIRPGDPNINYKYRELDVFKLKNELNIRVPSPVYGKGEDTYIPCKDVRDCYSQLREMVNATW